MATYLLKESHRNAVDSAFSTAQVRSVRARRPCHLTIRKIYLANRNKEFAANFESDVELFC